MEKMRIEEEKGNSYVKQEYIQNGRTLFRWRSDMFEAKTSFKNKAAYKDEKYLCDSCESEVNQNVHVLYCEAYKDLREGRKLDSDRDLANYLQQVFLIRSRLRLQR